MTEDTTKPTLDEKYTAARNSRDLTVGPSELPNRDSDVLAAAAWTQSRVGHALMQLHSEWDAAEKPAKPRKEAVERIAASIPMIEGKPDKDGKPTTRLDIVRAWEMANQWHHHEMAILLGKLKTLPAVRGEIADQAAKWGWQDPRTQSAEVLRWWLDQTCHACGGTKWKVYEGTTKQSTKVCGVCKGSGHSEVPHGQHGKKLANWMDEGVNIARRRIRKALRNYSKPD